MTPQRRWLQAAVKASAVPQRPQPYMRGQRRMPAVVRGLILVAQRPARINQR